VCLFEKLSYAIVHVDLKGETYESTPINTGKTVDADGVETGVIFGTPPEKLVYPVPSNTPEIEIMIRARMIQNSCLRSGLGPGRG
jgi:hypothetical protein